MLNIKAAGTKNVPVQQTKKVTERPFSITMNTRRDCEGFIVLLNAAAAAGLNVGPSDSDARDRATQLGRTVGSLIVSDGHLPRTTQLTAQARKLFGIKELS